MALCREYRSNQQEAMILSVTSIYNDDHSRLLLTMAGWHMGPNKPSLSTNQPLFSSHYNQLLTVINPFQPIINHYQPMIDNH